MYNVSLYKIKNEEVGLYYFNARWYDATIGRFITEDPARDGQNWYIYVMNNPLKFIDPTGMTHTDEYYEAMEEAMREQSDIPEASGTNGNGGGSEPPKRGGNEPPKKDDTGNPSSNDPTNPRQQEPVIPGLELPDDVKRLLAEFREIFEVEAKIGFIVAGGIKIGLFEVKGELNLGSEVGNIDGAGNQSNGVEKGAELYIQVGGENGPYLGGTKKTQINNPDATVADLWSGNNGFDKESVTTPGGGIGGDTTIDQDFKVGGTVPIGIGSLKANINLTEAIDFISKVNEFR